MSSAQSTPSRLNVVLFGATGMVGQGALRECLLDPDVARVLTVGRRATGQQHEKLREVVVTDMYDLSPIRTELAGFNACFFCLGVSSTGMTEERYARVTYDLTMVAAQTLVQLNPGMTFVFVSGMGTDSSERDGVMWARVKGRTENALLRIGFKAAYMFRPGFIVPQHGIKSRTTLYRLFYTVLAPLLPLFKKLAPNAVVTTESLGRAMIAVAKRGYGKPVLEARDISAASMGKAALP
jgi:uncharacterized protein YbjT (DUF2867 family)